MKHVNNNIICAVDCKITGKRPFYHDLVEIAIIPLDHSMSADRKRLPFHAVMRPPRPENITFKPDNKVTPRIMSKVMFADLIPVALDSWTLAQAFENWFAGLGLKPEKRIQVLSYNWAEIRPYVQDWLGFSDDPWSTPTMDLFFDPYHVRDLMSLSLYWNDVSHGIGDPCPFTRNALRFQALKLGIPWPNPDPKDTLSYAFQIIEVYKRMLDVKLPSGVPLKICYPNTINYDGPGEEYNPEDDTNDSL